MTDPRTLAEQLRASVKRVRIVIETAYYGSEGSGAFLVNSGTEVLPNAWLVLNELESLLSAVEEEPAKPKGLADPNCKACDGTGEIHSHNTICPCRNATKWITGTK